MVRLLRKFSISIFLIFISFCLFFCSTWVNFLFYIPDVVSKCATLLMYCPFILAIIIKLIFDIKNIRLNFFNLSYYIFAGYYVILTVFRFLNSMEIKDNLYYSIIFFGSVSIYSLIQTNKIKFSLSDYHANFIVYTVYLFIYYLIFEVILEDIFFTPPITPIYLTGAYLLFFPFIIDYIREKSPKKVPFVDILAILLGSYIIIMSSSRALFFLFIFVIVVLIVCCLKFKKAFISLLACCVSISIFIVILFAFNVGDVRYALYREMGPLYDIVFSSDNIDIENPDNIDKNDMFFIENQINQSDSMRNDLVKLGIEEIKKNPLFGTGNIYFEYKYQNYQLNEPSHNFIIESIIGYGIVGFLIQILIVISILFQMKLFSLNNNELILFKISFLLILGYYFVFSLVQPFVYAINICPLALIVMSLYEKILSQNEKIC